MTKSSSKQLKKRIADAVILGMREASAQYRSMTGNGLKDAPEYFVTTCIAQELHKEFYKAKKESGVLLEHPVKSGLTDAGSKKPGNRAKDERSDGRFDILLTADEHCWCAIEVKNAHTWAASISDMKRLRRVLLHFLHKSKISCGAIAIYVPRGETGRANIEQRIQDQADKQFKRGDLFEFDTDLVADKKGDEKGGTLYCLWVEIFERSQA
jgi:hypothetical protein